MMDEEQRILHNQLCGFWKDFCKTENLPQLSADELLLTHQLDCDGIKLTTRQEQVVRAFIVIWEATV